MAKPSDIRVLEWNDEQYVFFCTQHVPFELFKAKVTPAVLSELGEHINVEELDGKIKHSWFRMMSPTEASQRGYDFGYIETEQPEERKRGGPFPVTMLIL